MKSIVLTGIFVSILKRQKNMAFGKRVTNLYPLFLNGGKIDWVTSWKYLGVDLKSHHSFDCAIDGKLGSFYKCLNAIVRIEGRSNELVMLIPLLAYIDIW